MGGNTALEKLETITVQVVRVRSSSETFSVFTCKEEGKMGAPLTAKMWTGPAQPGQRWVLCGRVEDDPKWGRQFVGQFATLATPRNADDLPGFITSGLVSGWGLRELMAVVSAFGDGEALYEVLADQRNKLEEAGITDIQVAALVEMWERGAGLAPLYSQLAAWGIGGALSTRLVKKYRYIVLETLRTNPYSPIAEVPYYTWSVAETVSRHLDVAAEDPRRVQAGVAETVKRCATEQGHTWMTEAAAIMEARTLLGLTTTRITEILDEVVDPASAACSTSTLVLEDGRLYPGALWYAEEAIAADITRRLLNKRPLVTPEEAEALVLAEHLSAEQCAAVTMALSTPISLLTGGPGVGKTATIAAVVDSAAALRIGVTLLAPTGKAASRMAQMTGHVASTIHRRLRLMPGQLNAHEDIEPITGLCIVDELGMLDTTLAAALFSGIAPDAHVLLVGDPDQLPSVGPGAVLRDLLTADSITRVHLSRVFRNAGGIAVNAAHIRAGKPVVPFPDCQIVPTDDADSARNLVLHLVRKELPGLGYTGSDVLVLTPTNEGPAGRHTLNQALQEAINPDQRGFGITFKVEDRMGDRFYELCPGDKVIVVKNDTTLGVFNGDSGIIMEVDTRSKTIFAQIEGRGVLFRAADQRMLQLAYAITVHKSQGSEAPVVVVPVFKSMVLSRELLYTALTRARARVYLLGDEQAIQGAINVTRTTERHTGLVERLRTMIADHAPDYVGAGGAGESDTTPLPYDHWHTIYADNGESQVYHTRRAATPWKTSCGVDTTDASWNMSTPTRDEPLRPCLRCLASHGAVVAPFPPMATSSASLTAELFPPIEHDYQEVSAAGTSGGA